MKCQKSKVGEVWRLNKIDILTDLSMKNKISYIVAYGAIISTAIEVIQLQQTYNITDIDDIIFNTLGAILGYLVFNMFYKLMEKTKYSRKLKINFLGNE